MPQKLRFDALQEALRRELRRRIAGGNLTGTALAEATGFQQGHISNFLNRRRSLSLEALDRVLESQNLSVLDLIPADYTQKAEREDSLRSFQSVPVVSHAAAARQRITGGDILEYVHVPETALHHARERPAPARSLWQRFVGVRVDGMQVAAMDPLLRQGSVVILDRHATTLTLYRSQSPPIYAVRRGQAFHLCFLEVEEYRLILRPRNPEVPVRLIAISSTESARDFIIGRVCYILSEA
jgi:transcriptional regulator with XRE-family HTH domain